VTYGDLLEAADPGLPIWWRPSIWWRARISARRDAADPADRGRRRLDALIVLGDDQNESYRDDCRPAFAIYFGDTIRTATHSTDLLAFPIGNIENRKASSRRKRRALPVIPRSRSSDRSPHGHRLRSRQLQMPAAGEGEGPRDRLRAPPRDDAENPVPGRADLSQYLLPAQSAAPARCHAFRRPVRPGGREFFPAKGDRHPRLRRPQHFLVDEEFDRAILKASPTRTPPFLQNCPQQLNAAARDPELCGGQRRRASEMNWFE